MSDPIQLTPHEHVRVRRHDASALEVEVEWLPGGSAPPAHFHPAQDERFEVLAGVVSARVDGVERRLVPGDVLEIPRGAVHQLHNDGDEPARAVWETCPAGRTLEWFEGLGAAQDGGPRALIPLLAEYRDVFRLAQRPRAVVRAVVAALAVLMLALPGAAQADSIAYIKDHDVWIASPDGSKQHQVTKDGEADWGYGSPSLADDGTIVARRGTDIVTLAQNGRELARFDPPDSTDSAGQPIGGVPANVAVSPNGKRIAFTYYQANCPPGVACMTRYVTLTTAGGKTFLNNPSWVSDERMLVFGGFGSQVQFSAAAGLHDDRDYWFDDRDMFGVEESEDLTDGELSRDGRRFVAVRSYGPNTHLMIYKVDDFSGPPAYACNTGNEETLDSPTWSPDGTKLAFAHKDGVEVLPLPSVEPDCPGAQSGTVVLPGASEPDWGSADVNPGPVPADPEPRPTAVPTSVPTAVPTTTPVTKPKPKTSKRRAALRKCRAKKTKRARRRCVRRVRRRNSATASAAVARQKSARFVAYIAGKQVTEWNVPKHGVGSNCQGQRYLEAGGKETLRFRTKPFRLLVYTNQGYGPFVKVGTWSRFKPAESYSRPSTGSAERTGQIVNSLAPGECHDSGDPTTGDTGPYDCGRRSYNPFVSLGWRGDKVAVSAVGSLEPGYENCPLDSPLAADFATIEQSFPARDVFDRSRGLHVVLGRKQQTEKIHRDHGTATTTTTFTLRLRRADR